MVSWRAAVVAALPLLLTGCGVGYLVEQATGQIGMLARRESIADVLRDPRTDAVTRDRLILVWYARRFAAQRLGLNVGQSFHDVVRLNRDAASYVVAAAPPDSLVPHLWCFPVAGCLPYIGYFDRAKAMRETRRMAALGFDVAMRGVSAYSLGGWLPDPIYSPLLRETRGWIANTVIHELTHGTVFLAGRADFNESMATFVGDRGELMFLAERYGSHSRIVAIARAQLSDQRTYNTYLATLQARLRELYASPISRDEKLARRREVFARARDEIRALPFVLARNARLADRPLDNAMLATHATYFGFDDLFEATYVRVGSDLRAFVAFLRDHVAHERQPDVWLAHWVAEHPMPSGASSTP